MGRSRVQMGQRGGGGDSRVVKELQALPGFSSAQSLPTSGSVVRLSKELSVDRCSTQIFGGVLFGSRSIDNGGLSFLRLSVTN